MNGALSKLSCYALYLNILFEHLHETWHKTLELYEPKGFSENLIDIYTDLQGSERLITRLKDWALVHERKQFCGSSHIISLCLNP